MGNIFNDLIKPVFIEERKECHIPYEYLKELSLDDCIKLAKKINDSNTICLIFNCLYSSNEKEYFNSKILDYINKNKIETLSFDNYIRQEQLNGFEHVSFLSLHLDKCNKIDLSSFVNIEHISLQGYNGNNIVFPNDKSISLYFYETGSKTFKYTIECKNLESVSFTGFKCIDLSNISSKIKNLDFYKVKELKFCKELNYIKKIRFEKCDFEKIDINDFSNMKDLQQIEVENCKNVDLINSLQNYTKIDIK